jgi:hypothetical protein
MHHGGVDRDERNPVRLPNPLHLPLADRNSVDPPRNAVVVHLPQGQLPAAGEVSMTAADDYLRSVSFELGDLPWGKRQELLAEIRTHLDELPAGTDLRARLGTPKEYAADLRAAAGLERRRGAIAFLRARRPRNLILVALILIVIGLAIGAVEWVDSYQPLAFQSGAEIFPPVSAEVPGGTSVSAPSTRAARSGSASTSRTPGGSPCECSACPPGAGCSQTGS